MVARGKIHIEPRRRRIYRDIYRYTSYQTGKTHDVHLRSVRSTSAYRRGLMIMYIILQALSRGNKKMGGGKRPAHTGGKGLLRGGFLCYAPR